MSLPYRVTATLVSFSLLLVSACASIRPQINSTVVTAVPKDVERCRRVGFVAIDSPEGHWNDGLDQLRADAVHQGGNTVLVTSYATSTSGTAYLCEPPLTPPDQRPPQPAG